MLSFLDRGLKRSRRILFRGVTTFITFLSRFTLGPSRSQIATSFKFVYLTEKLGGSEWESNPPATGKPAARRF